MSRPKRKFIDTLSEWCAEAPLSEMQRALDLLTLAVQWKTKVEEKNAPPNKDNPHA